MINTYIIKAFCNEMDSFHINYKIYVDNKGKCVLEYINIPIKLDSALLRAVYEESKLVNKVESIFGDIKYFENTYKNICDPHILKNDRILRIYLDDEYYWDKLNKVSNIIRDYYHDHYTN